MDDADSEGFQLITLEFQDDVAGTFEFCWIPGGRAGHETTSGTPAAGQSSLGQLQSAAAKVEAQARGERRRAHQKAVEAAQPDPREVAATYV